MKVRMLMYKVLIVDDEHIVQLALKSLIQWSNIQCEIVGVASNGKEAMEIIQGEHIDVLITDINMPMMNGIALIEWIYEQKLDIKMIVLSAYNDFEYVRKAFKFGVEDYILKSEMDPEVVTDMVKKLLESKQSSSTQSSNIQSSTAQSSTAQSTNILSVTSESSKNLTMVAMIEGRLDLDLEALKTSFTDHEIDAWYNCCVLLVDDYNRILNQYDEEEMQEFLKHVLDTIQGRLSSEQVQFILPLSAGEYCLVIERFSKQEKENRQRISAFLRNIQNALEVYMNIRVTIGAWDNDFRLGKVKMGYEMAKELAELRYIYGKSRIIYSEDAKLIRQVESKSIVGSVDSLIQSIHSLNQINVDKELDHLLNEIGSYKGKSLQHLIGNYMELLLTVIINLRNLNNDLMDAFDHQTDFYKLLSQFDTKEEVHQWMKNFVKNLMLYMIDNAKNEVSTTILQARKYIDNNYMLDITLTRVAEEVELSETYFSKLFVKETGETFIQYLTKKRINRAGVMLRTTPLKVYEIAEKVGYENVEHFSRVFKKIIGVSPNQYKKSKIYQ